MVASLPPKPKEIPQGRCIQLGTSVTGPGYYYQHDDQPRSIEDGTPDCPAESVGGPTMELKLQMPIFPSKEATENNPGVIGDHCNQRTMHWRRDMM